MFNVLRGTSIFIAIISVCAAITLISSGLKDNPEMNAFLRSPGSLEGIRDTINSAVSQNNTDCPLVVQARAFALRIDPPHRIEEQRLRAQETTVAAVEKEQISQHDDRIKLAYQQTDSFDLLATVRYVSVPEKSLALFQNGGRQEWFLKGQTFGIYKIEDIKDGHVILAQAGGKSRDIRVPSQSNTKSLLKNH